MSRPDLSLLSSAKEILRSRIETSSIPLRLLRDIRFETHLAFLRVRGRLSPLMRRRAHKLRAMHGVKLHFGCGPHTFPGWLNLDGWRRVDGIDYACDLRRPLPLRDGSCRLIFTDHVLCMFDLQFLPGIMREFYRLLEPGGTIRIVEPDCARVVAAYLRNDMHWARGVFPNCSTAGDLLNAFFHEHFRRFVFDLDSLTRLLCDAGFGSIRESSHQGSHIEELRLDTGGTDRIATNLYIEADK